MKFSVFLLALGVFALPLSAHAQEGSVTVYGTLQPFLDNFRTSDATPPGLSPANGGATQVPLEAYTGEDLPNRFRITSGTSNIGFKGDIKITKHLSAFFQVENYVNPDGDPQVLLSPWASRNSGVGLKGDYGTLFFGNWDTPFKHPTLFVGPVRGLNPFDDAISGTPGFNVPVTTTQNGRASARADAAFNRRQGNSIQYWTPTFYGISARAVVSVNEGRTRATPIEPSISPVLWGGSLTYAIGTFSATYAYEQHLDYFGTNWVGGTPGASLTNKSSKDDAHELVAWYTAPTGTRLAAVVDRLTYRTDETIVGNIKSYQRDSIYGAIQQHIAEHTIWGGLGVGFAGRCVTFGSTPCTTNGLNALQWSVGYTFSPVKTFDIYASYYEMHNARSGAYGFFPPVVPLAPGTTTHAFGLGFMFIFDVTTKFGGKPETPEPAPPPAPVTTPPPAVAPPPAEPASSEGSDKTPVPAPAEPGPP